MSGWELKAPVSRCVNLLIYETVHAIDSIYRVLHRPEQATDRASLNASFVIGSIAEVLVKENNNMPKI